MIIIVEWIQGFDNDHVLVKQYQEQVSKGLPCLDIHVITDMKNWLQTPWIDDNGLYSIEIL